MALGADGPVVQGVFTLLGDLVAFGQIRVEVVLAGPHGQGVDAAAAGQAHLDGVFHGFDVGHGQGAGHAQAHGTDQGIGLGAEFHLASAEHLGAG